MTPPAELDRIERQLAAALWRARELGWLDGGPVAPPEPVHPSPVYRELERLSSPVGLVIPSADVVASEDMNTNRIAS